MTGRRRTGFQIAQVCYSLFVGVGMRRLDEGGSPMKPTRKLNRRSFIGAVTGAAAAAGALGIVFPAPAEAFQCSDSDSGQNGDPGGQGRRCGGRRVRTGCTDRDGGQYADGIGYGRRCGGSRSITGCSDSDSGRYADGSNRGRNCRTRQSTGCSDGDSSDASGQGRHCNSGCSDSDSGSYADRASAGRHCGGAVPRRSCSDSDTGQYADPISRGRRC
jgi:hypothetical protein